MSLNLRRNIFTLGDFKEKLKMRSEPEKDPFEKDPFKVHSYNFRYAERPHAIFPVASTQIAFNNSQHTNNCCQTYFYNYGFDSNDAVNVRQSTSLANNERIANLNDFQEHRRKKFLQDQASSSLFRDQTQSKILKVNVASTSSQTYNKLNLGSVKRPSFMQMSRPSCSLTNSQNINSRRDIRIKRPLTPQPQTESRIFRTFSSPLSDINIKRTRLGSGCEININLKKSEDKPLQDNINIKIETDSHKNLNFNSGSSIRNNFQQKNNNDYSLKSYGSSDTFVVDRKPTKYSMKCPEVEGSLRKKESERFKALTAIYSSPVLKKPSTKRNVNLQERIPSRIPFGLSNTNTLYENNSNFMNNSLFRSKSLLESKSHNNKSGISAWNVQTSPYNNLSFSSSKRLYSLKPKSRDNLPLSTTRKSDLKMSVPLRLTRSKSSKLPVNVNINVYADKLKLLKY